ncbi:hypothetical protein Syun_019506 [Stephania yunnanensis]|uniref:Uncharacterized protein n=1 Tax=Stephania yunnanensis TaxID=152371 RepID=A0AAP0IUB0_9MAGN
MREDSSMRETIALSLLGLMNQNTIIVQSSCNGSKTHLVTCDVAQLTTATRSVLHHYSTKVATKNVMAFSSCSNDLLQFRLLQMSLFFIDSLPEKSIVLKEAISCLASITNAFKVNNIFI